MQRGCCNVVSTVACISTDFMGTDVSSAYTNELAILELWGARGMPSAI